MSHVLTSFYGEPNIQKVAKSGSRKCGLQRARWMDQVERDPTSIFVIDVANS